MRSPSPTVKLVALAAVVFAAAAVAPIVADRGSDGLGSGALIGAVAVLVFTSRLWPIVTYLDASSPGHHLDEGFFLLSAVVLPARGVLVAFVIGTALAEVARRRAVGTAVFEVATNLAAAGAGLAVIGAIKPSGTMSLGPLSAALLGTAAYACVTWLLGAAMAQAAGSERFWRALTAGVAVRVGLLGASALVGLVGAVCVTAYPWSIVFVGALYWVLHEALAGHFRAGHDRSRLLGLFDATLEINRRIGEDDVTSALAERASALFGSAATVGERPPRDGSLGARMQVNGSDRWLVVGAGARRAPFDQADRALLDALASVGAAALVNTELYEERTAQQENLVAITSSLGEGVCAFTDAGHVRFVNPAAEALLGWSGAELLEKRDGSVESELAFLWSPALRAMRYGTTIESERATFCRRDGQLFPVEYTCSPIRSGDGVVGAVVTFRDISDRVKVEEQLEFHAFHDPLTGLANRRAFVERLTHALERSARSGGIHAVLFADVDRFKTANDSLGHQAGDQLLVAVAARLLALTRSSDTLARFGGDEFTLLIEDIDGARVAEEIAARMVEAVRAPIVLDTGQAVRLGVSVGIALGSAGANPDDILHDADVAMYQAKRAGSSRYEFFDSIAMGPRSSEYVELEVELEGALERGELLLHYQPIFAATSLNIVGAEALVRWNHPRRGMLTPKDFIGLAEETGMIARLGKQVLEQAAEQAVAWRGSLGVPVEIAVNLSARQFAAQGLVADIEALLGRTRLAPGQLCIEITEGLALQDSERAIATLRELKALGVRLALDDFGTGYSSLNYLRRFPVDVVKLDRSFVQDLTTSAVGSAIVGAIIDLSRTIGFSVVAEGVETEEEFRRLVQMGCPLIQGHWLARPMPAEELSSRLSTRFDGTRARALRLLPEPVYR